ncbi:Z-DNA-binding protein 1 isoform X2 [Hyla sarda]|nr:Z-DNA-binding protein 1 isoform X2 [Hyla sarda]XP_056403999.1 Z-DNA-binding protein 1 isoform X2 [Hyla sarda]
MLKKNLLEQNGKFWKIKALATRDTDGPTGDKIAEDSGVSLSNGDNNAEGKADTGGTDPVEKMILLTEMQKQIFAFLKLNKPSKATMIAKAVGKTFAKDVNPDLYKMKQLNFLSYNERLWSINEDCSQKLSESSIPSSEDSVLSQSYIEMDVCNLSDNKDIRRDSGIEVMSPLPNNTIRDKSNLIGPHTGKSHLQYEGNSPSPNNTIKDESNLTGVPTGDSHLQYESQMSNSQQNVMKYYYINLSQCTGITIGDTALQTKGDAETVYTVLPPDTFLHGPGGNSQPLPSEMPAHQTGPPWEVADWVVNQPSEIGPFGAPRTSSPVPSSNNKYTLNISGICEDLGNVALDEQDKNCEDHVVISSSAESLW